MVDSEKQVTVKQGVMNGPIEARSPAFLGATRLSLTVDSSLPPTAPNLLTSSSSSSPTRVECDSHNA